MDRPLKTARKLDHSSVSSPWSVKLYPNRLLFKVGDSRLGGGCTPQPLWVLPKARKIFFCTLFLAKFFYPRPFGWVPAGPRGLKKGLCPKGQRTGKNQFKRLWSPSGGRILCNRQTSKLNYSIQFRPINCPSILDKCSRFLRKFIESKSGQGGGGWDKSLLVLFLQHPQDFIGGFGVPQISLGDSTAAVVSHFMFPMGIALF